VAHDRIGRLALEFLAGAPSCALPPAAALLAFGKHHHLDVSTIATVRAVVVAVEAAERSRAAA